MARNDRKFAEIRFGFVKKDKFKFFQKKLKKGIDKSEKKSIIVHVASAERTAQHNMRMWRNWQTRTFEGRVVFPYGFKSHHPHQNKRTPNGVLFVLRSGGLEAEAGF